MVNYTETNDSRLPAARLSLMKSATLPQVWLSRIPEESAKVVAIMRSCLWDR